MGAPEPHLDPHGINILLDEIGAENFIPDWSLKLNADLGNRVSVVLGCYDNKTINNPAPDEEGSNLFLVLMYQNLLLAKRVTELEARINDK